MRKKRPKLLVVGSFVMDQIVRTSVFPREGETVLGNSFHMAPGGKGANQAVQAARLGAEVTMVGKLGSDQNAKIMREACEDAGVIVDNLLYDSKELTGCSIIVVEENPNKPAVNRIIVVSGSNMTITPDEVAFLKDTIHEYDLVLLQLEIPMDVNAAVCKWAEEANVPVMLNPAPSAKIPKSILSRLTFISPNETEAENLIGIKIDESSTEQLEFSLKSISEELLTLGPQNVLITLGSKGAYITDGTDTHYSPCVENVQAVDPTAAGDSFVAAFSCAVCLGMNHEDAIIFANHVAAITVSRMGAMPSLPHLEEVKTLLQSVGKNFPQLETL